MSEERREYTIYKLYCKDPSVKEVYIGETFDLKNRKRQHKNACNTPNNKEYNYSKYVFIREHGGYFNWDYDEIDKVYGYKRDAEKLETEYIRKFSLNCLNTRVSFLTKEERKEAKLKCFRDDYKKNPEKHKNRAIEAYHKDPEKHRKRARDDYKKNPEKRKKAVKKCYKKNGGVKISCNFCKATVTRCKMKRHQNETITCKTVQLKLPFDSTLHKMCSVCDTKILIKDESFMHNCEFEIEDDNKPLKKKRKL